MQGDVAIIFFRQFEMPVDSVAYLTFWTVVSFSFFIVSDEVSGNLPSGNGILPAVTALRSSVHSLGIGCICLTVAEVWKVSEKEDWMKVRPLHIEWASSACAISLLVLNLVVSLQDTFDGQGHADLFAYRFLPWLVINPLIAYQLVSVVRA